MANNVEKELSKAEMELPAFNFKEVEELYEHDLTISDELYDSILHKDRKLLIEDLEKVFLHAVDKYEIFNADNVAARNTFFVWHAIFLLKDLEATETLPAILHFLKQDEELVSLYLGDGVSDFGWQIFYSLGNKQLRLLVDYCKSSPDDYTVRPEMTETLKQIALHEPERRLEIESYLRELLFYASSISIEEDSFIDDLTDKVLESIGQLSLTRLFPDVEKLFNEDKLSAIFILDWDHFENEYKRGEGDANALLRNFETRKEIYTGYLEAQEENDDDDYDSNLYDDIDDYLYRLDKNDAYEDSLEETDDEDLEEDEENKNKSYIDYKELHTPFVKKEPDVGRNDPCPCGSGKKYKKCHGKS